MSGGVLFRHALAAVEKLAIPELAKRNLGRCLDRAQPGPLPVIWEAGTDAGLEREVLIRRGVGLFFLFTAGNLADDLADGDLDYVDPPLGIGPAAQYGLQNLGWQWLLTSGISAETAARAAGRLAEGAGPQHLEVTTKTWTAALFREVATGIAGCQYGAYLELLWDGTPLAGDGAAVGEALGKVGQVVMDAETDDRRFWSMSEGDRREVLRWGRDQADLLRTYPYAVVRGALVGVDHSLSRLANDDVAAWYRRKTDEIVAKYGPGPKIHFHTGLWSGDLTGSLQERLVQSQERVLERMFSEPLPEGQRWLDVGCGLGGTTLWLAERGLRVRGITLVDEHRDQTLRLAALAGVAERVEAAVEDAHVAQGIYDGAVAIESSCYFVRPRWFERMSGALKPGASLWIGDHFSSDPAFCQLFDAYWRTRLGDEAHDDEAARAHGFSLVEDHDVTAETVGFWEASADWTASKPPSSPFEAERARKSVDWHRRMALGARNRTHRVRLRRYILG